MNGNLSNDNDSQILRYVLQYLMGPYLVIVHPVNRDNLGPQGRCQPRPMLGPEQPLRVRRDHHVEPEITDLIKRLPE